MREIHRVGRVLSFSSVAGIGTPPTPNPQASVPPLWFWGEGHTRWRERGVGESQIRRGEIHCGTLYICTLWGNSLSVSTGRRFACIGEDCLINELELLSRLITVRVRTRLVKKHGRKNENNFDQCESSVPMREVSNEKAPNNSPTPMRLVTSY